VETRCDPGKQVNGPPWTGDFLPRNKWSAEDRYGGLAEVSRRRDSPVRAQTP